jgi:hypothetical protein
MPLVGLTPVQGHDSDRMHVSSHMFDSGRKTRLRLYTRLRSEDVTPVICATLVVCPTTIGCQTPIGRRESSRMHDFSHMPNVGQKTQL